MGPHSTLPNGRILAGAALAATLFACQPDVNPVGPILATRNGVSNSEPLASPVWQAIAASQVTEAKLSPTVATRFYSLVGVAQYLAVQRAEAHSGERDGDNEDGGRSRRASDRGAVAGASVVVLKSLLPAAKAQALEDSVTAQRGVGSVQSQLAFARGEAIGRAVGAEIVTRGQADGFATPFSGTIPIADTLWKSNTNPATLVGGNLPGVRPWFLTSASQFRSTRPAAFGSPAFLAALKVVRDISDIRTHEQDSIATYWAQGVGSPTTPGFWLQFATGAINHRGFSERRATHLYALMSAAMFDAQIGCWDSKMTYWYIRPWQADHGITLVDAVGKPVPPNHPSYPSGHSCISSAAGEVLSAFFPEKRAQFQAMVVEAGLSRVYGGIHYQFDCDAGQLLGRSVARFAIRVDRSGESVLGGDDDEKHDGRR